MLQKEALDILKMGHNVFLTGAAGSGKTHTLRAYIEYLRKNNVEVAITASTGIAATHLGGMTIHAWSGLGIKDRLTEHDIEILEEKQHLWKKYQNTKVLIIDEISMLHHFRFDMLDRLAKAFKRQPDIPFGGLQIILCGDFFQLPPVHRLGEQPAYFAYQSDVWKQMQRLESANKHGLKICYLTEQHRQNDDSYLSLLNDIRGNCVEEGSLEFLRERYQQDIDPELFPNIIPTRLFSHNADVDTMNEKELKSLKGDEEFYLMDTKGKSNLVESLTKSCLAPMELRLKLGARVMFVKNNFDKGYANGTLGTVIGFDEIDRYPIIKTSSDKEIKAEPEAWMIEEDGKIKAEIRQLPLRLAWAITIHKSQGMSLDAAEIDLSKSFVAGMGYVALSRVKSLAGLKLIGFNNSALQVHPEILEFDYHLRQKSEEALNMLTEISETQGKAAVQDIQRDFIEKNASAKSRASYATQVDEDGTERTVKLSAQEETKLLLVERKSIADIAKARKIKEETVIDHIEKLILDGALMRDGVGIEYLRNHSYKDGKSRLRFERIKEIFMEIDEKDMKKAQAMLKQKSGEDADDNAGDNGAADTNARQAASLRARFKLAPVKQKLGNSYSYNEIRLAKIFVLDELQAA